MAYNASQAKSPVTYNLEETNWQAYIQGYTFMFSTMAHRDKFLEKVNGHIQWMNDSMTRRFHMPCSFARLAVFQLYMQIEGRGFLVYDSVEGCVYHKPEDVTFVVDAVYTMDGWEE